FGQVSELVAALEPEPEVEPEPAMAVAEEAHCAEPKEAVSEPIEAVSEPKEAVSEPIEAETSVLEPEPCEFAIAKATAPTDIEGQDREWSREPEPVEQGQPVPYQIVVTAEEPAEIASAEGPEVSSVPETAGVGRAIAGISM